MFRGALDCHAREINESMCLAAANALADMIAPEDLTREYIIPSIFNKDVCSTLAKAVGKAAVSSGVSRDF
ncbi:MAG TPA: malic enzyme-like NAD(P)-binding protein [Clostridia bacterium]|nr:malic enzyme-like NAD(P)-binding protein [Clostridia bacterium]